MIAIPIAVFAGPVAKMSGSGQFVDWQINVSSYDHIVLRVSAPDGEVYSKVFPAGRTVTFSLKDDLPGAEAGTYTWSIEVAPVIPASIRRQLQEARAGGDDAAARKLLRSAGIGQPIQETGSFTVGDGGIMTSGLNEPGVIEQAREGLTGPSGSGSPARPGTPVVNDQVIPDDLIVQGSLCVGLDCVNNENFGFDTIRLKENNLRIHFDDTSTSAGFPANDWRIIANDSASGGSSKFSIEDSTSAKTPLTITAGAATNSIFADSTGRIGFRTSTPVLDLHVNTSNTPAIRLEQNNSGGFTAQTWDIGANEANFFVRDLTSGSRLPLRIRPGAPTSSIDISASGKVGIGTASPDEQLDVVVTTDANMGVEVGNPSTGLNANAFFRSEANVASVSFQSHSSTRTIGRFGQTLASFNEMLATAGNGLILGTLNATPLILGTNNGARLTIDSGGNITVPGNFTVSGTKNFGVPDPADATKAIYFSALEGPEAGTYYRGTAKTVNGEITIKMPGAFARMTESERMTVQLTPIGAPGQLYVASRSPEQIVIKVAEGSADIEFDYLVQGVRRGYLNFEVERENNLTNPR